MADDLDRASALTEQHTADALARHRRQMAAAGKVSAENCIECDEPIPPARQRAVVGVVRCVDCQALLEKR